jgi:hypothetical protein
VTIVSAQRVRYDLRNFLCAMRFWIRRLSSGSVTSVQSSVLVFDLDLDDPECRLELEGCLEDRDDISGVSLSVSEPE